MISATFLLLMGTKVKEVSSNFTWTQCNKENDTLEFPSLFTTIERFSFECRKTKTKVIILTNHNKRKKRNEPIRTRSKCMQPAPSAGKHVRPSHDWFWFSFSLVEKVARVLLTNHRAQQSQTKAITKLHSTLN